MLNGIPNIFGKYQTLNTKNVLLLLSSRDLYYLMLHLRLSTTWYSTQLIEIFSYENPSEVVTNSKKIFKQISKNVIVYNLHNLFSQERIFVISQDLDNSSSQLKSVSELFANANWLERETSEMSGVNFLMKKDTRNLLLTYGDSSNPLRKSNPSIGFKEIFFDSNSDSLIQTPLTVQL